MLFNLNIFQQLNVSTQVSFSWEIGLALLESTIYHHIKQLWQDADLQQAENLPLHPVDPPHTRNHLELGRLLDWCLLLDIFFPTWNFTEFFSSSLLFVFVFNSKIGLETQIFHNSGRFSSTTIHLLFLFPLFWFLLPKSQLPKHNVFVLWFSHL